MDDPERAVERAAIDAAFEAERRRIEAAVSQADTSVDLSGSGGKDPETVAEELTEAVEPVVKLHFDDDEYLSMMDAELRRLDDHGMLDGLNVITDDPTRFDTDKDLKDRASGLYNNATRELYIAPEETIGEEPRERQARPGYFSTDKNFGSVWHELGHHRIRHENPDMDFEAMDGEDFWGQETIELFAAEWFPPERMEEVDPEKFGELDIRRARNNLADAIDEEVSEYANFGGMEYIAEVFAGMMAGNEYPEWVVELHSRLSGPIPPEGVRDPDTAFVPMVAPVGADAEVRPQAIGADTHVRRLRRMGAEVTTITEIGDDLLVNFHAPGAEGNELPGGIQFRSVDEVSEATIRFPSLQEASQATRNILNRFPETIAEANPPGDRFVAEGFEGHQASPERGELLVRTRLNDLRGTNKVRPHVHLDGGFPATFDAADVLDFFNRAFEAYEAEFAPFAPRDDIDFVDSGDIEAQMSDLEIEIQNLTAGVGHSYRNFAVSEFADALDKIDDLDDQLAQVDRLRQMRGAVGFIEGGRFAEYIEAVSEFFDRLDHDEQELFTKRNPDTVRWMSVWNRANELRPYDEFVELAKESQDDSQEATDPPPFDPGDGPLDTRRRSYRNFAPGEFVEFAHEKGSKFAAREALERVESGRFKPMLRETFEFFVPLDPDEITAWSRRNPGLTEWISVEAWLEDLRFGDQLLNLSEAEFPFVEGAGPRPDEFTVEGQVFGQDGDFGEWPWSRDKSGLKACEERMEGEVDNQFAFCRAWANEEGIDIDEEGRVSAQGQPIPERLRDALESFDPDSFDIDGTGSPRTPFTSQWDHWSDANAGVSGLFFPEHGLMVVDNRQASHHNQQWNAVVNRGMADGEDAPSPVMPFTVDRVGGRWRIEMARSHGGLFQALAKSGLEDEVKSLTNGQDIEPRWVWAVVYTARLLDIPESGEIQYSFKQPGVSVDPNFAETFTTGLETMYREMQFDGLLPEPLIDRESLAEQGGV